MKPLLNRLHREFNISVCEIDDHDVWQSATIGCALIGTDNRHVQRALQNVSHWVDTNWPDVSLVDEQLELI